MKTLIAALILLVTSSAQALTIPYEYQAGLRRSDPYLWRYAYNIGLIDDVLKIDVDIKLYGAPVPASTLSSWESEIENTWSTNRFDIPILFNVDWVTGDNWTFAVDVADTRGRWTMLHWFLGSESGAAHEFGHMVSMYDEYAGGAVNPETRRINTGGLMAVDYGPTLDYYYDPFLSWYEAKVASLPHDTEPVPEPSTIALLALGLASLLVLKKRSTV